MKLYRNIIIIIATIAILGTGAFFVYKYEPETPTETPTTDNNTQEMFNIFSIDTKSIVGVRIKNFSEEYLIKKSGDKWVLNGDDSIVLGTAKMETYLHTFSSVYAKQTVSETDKDDKAFGFDENCSFAEIFLKDGTSKKILVGNKSLDGDNYYVKIYGEKTVYLKNTYGTESIIPQSDSLRDLTLLKVSTDKISTINKIQILKTGNTPIKIEKEVNGSGDNKTYSFKMTEPVYSEISGTVLSENIVEKISELKADAVIEDNAKDLSVYGLDKPYAEFSIKTDSFDKKLIIGRDTESYRFVKEEKTNTVYAVKKSALEFLDVSYIDLMSKLIHVEYLKDLNKVEIVSGDTKYTFLIKGNENNYEYFINDKKIAKNDFTSVYQSVIGITLESVDLDAKPNVAPDAYIKYTKKDGSVSKVEFLPSGERNYRVTVDGKGNCVTSRKNLNDMLDKIKQTLNNAE